MSSMLIQSILSGVVLGCIFTLIATGLAIIWGVVRMVNFAHGSFMMLSMYIAYFMATIFNIDPILSIPICAGALFVFGVAVYKIMAKRLIQGKFLMQVFGTFGLMMALDHAVMVIWGAQYRVLHDTWFGGTVEIGGYYFGEGQLIAAALSLVVLGLVTLFLFYTKMGKALRASADDEVAAETVGIDSEKMYTYAWGIGSACIGVTGALMANFFYIYPQVGMVFMFFGFVCVALTGFGKTKGMLIAGLTIGIIRSTSGFVIGPWTKDVMIFAVFVAILLLMPQGLFKGK